MPRPLLRHVRVPRPDELPPGPLQTTRLDADLIQRGLILAPLPKTEEEDEDDEEEEEYPPTLADKLRLLFDALHPDRGRRGYAAGLGRRRSAAGF